MYRGGVVLRILDWITVILICQHRFEQLVSVENVDSCANSLRENSSRSHNNIRSASDEELHSPSGCILLVRAMFRRQRLSTRFGIRALLILDRLTRYTVRFAS